MVILDLHEFNAMAGDPVGKKPMFRLLASDRPALQGHALVGPLRDHERAGRNSRRLLERLFPEALAIIRETNPDRTVVIGGELEQPVRPGLAPSASGRPEHHRHGPLLQSLSVHPSGRRLDPRIQGHLRHPMARHGRRPGRYQEGLRGRPEVGRGRETSPVPGRIGAYDKAEMASRPGTRRPSPGPRRASAGAGLTGN